MRKVLKKIFGKVNLEKSGVFFLVLSVVFSFIVVGGKGRAEEVSAVVAAEKETQCLVGMKKFVDKEFLDYRNFLEEHFKSKDSTKSLLDVGVQKFEEFKYKVEKKLEEYFKLNNEGGDIRLQAIRLNSCNDFATNSIDDARKLLELRAVRTSNIKETTVMLEKYQAINGKLRNLNSEMQRMKANLETFSQKLPCYLRKNCTKK